MTFSFQLIKTYWAALENHNTYSLGGLRSSGRALKNLKTSSHCEIWGGSRTSACKTREGEALRHKPSLKHGFKHLNYQVRGGKTVLAAGKENWKTASHLATYLRRKQTTSLDCKCQVESNEFTQATVLRISQCNLFCHVLKSRIWSTSAKPWRCTGKCSVAGTVCDMGLHSTSDTEITAYRPYVNVHKFNTH